MCSALQMGGNDMVNFPSSCPNFGRGGYGNRGEVHPNREGFRRGPHHNNMPPPPPPVDPEVLPLPIIKKEELEQFQDVQTIADGWANSASEIDFKLVFMSSHN